MHAHSEEEGAWCALSGAMLAVGPISVMMGGMFDCDSFEVWHAHGGALFQVPSAFGGPPRTGFAMTAHAYAGGALSIFVAGGNTPFGRDNRAMRSDDLGVTWSPAGEEWGAPWTPRSSAAIALSPCGQQLTLTGGYAHSSEGALPRDVWSLDVHARQWRERCAFAPWSPRWGHSAVYASGALLVMGGKTARRSPVARWGANASCAALLADVWSSRDGGGSWTLLLRAAPWAPRFTSGLLLLPGGGTTDRAVILGGMVSEDQCVADAWATPDGAIWTPPTPL